MSGTDPVGDNGKAGADGKNGRARMPIAQMVLWARMEATGTGMWARTLRRYSYAGANVIAKKTLNQNFDFDCVLTFLRGKKII
jgi:hypothetical protein